MGLGNNTNQLRCFRSEEIKCQQSFSEGTERSLEVNCPDLSLCETPLQVFIWAYSPSSLSDLVVVCISPIKHLCPDCLAKPWLVAGEQSPSKMTYVAFSLAVPCRDILDLITAKNVSSLKAFPVHPGNPPNIRQELFFENNSSLISMQIF